MGMKRNELNKNEENLIFFYLKEFSAFVETRWTVMVKNRIKIAAINVLETKMKNVEAFGGTVFTKPVLTKVCFLFLHVFVFFSVFNYYKYTEY